MGIGSSSFGFLDVNAICNSLEATSASSKKRAHKNPHPKKKEGIFVLLFYGEILGEHWSQFFF